MKPTIEPWPTGSCARCGNHIGPKVDSEDTAHQASGITTEQLVELKQYAPRRRPDRNDVTLWPKPERLELLEGPQFAFYSGDHEIGRLPIRLLVNTSSKFQAEFSPGNSYGTPESPPGPSCPNCTIVSPLLAKPMQVLIDYFNTTMTKRTPFIVPLGGFERDIGILFAANAVGFNNYVRHINSYWWTFLKTKHVSELEKDVFPVLDNQLQEGLMLTKLPIFSMLVNRLARDEPGYQLLFLDKLNEATNNRRKELEWQQQARKKSTGNGKPSVLEIEEPTKPATREVGTSPAPPPAPVSQRSKSPPELPIPIRLPPPKSSTRKRKAPIVVPEENMRITRSRAATLNSNYEMIA